MRLIRLLIFMFFNVARRLQRRWRRDANGKSRALMLDHFWLGGPGVQQNNFRCYRCRSIHRCAGIGGRPAGQGAAARLWSVATNWTGCYVNGGVGYDLSNRDHFSFNETGFVNRDGTSGARGYLGRVGGGCDYQFSPAGGWATGSSARSPDYDLMNLHGGFTDAATLVTAPSRENWAAAAGGRIGVLVTSQVLTYVNGGWTSTRLSGVDFPRGADHLANTDF